MPAKYGGYYRRNRDVIEYWVSAKDYANALPSDGCAPIDTQHGFKGAVLKALGKIRMVNPMLSLSDAIQQENYWSFIRLPEAIRAYRRERARGAEAVRYHKRQVQHVITQIRTYRATIDNWRQ